MNARRLLYLGVAATGISVLGAYAYFAQRAPQRPVEQTASAAPSGTTARPAAGGAGPAAVDVAKVSSLRLLDDINAVGAIRSNESVIMRPEVAGRITR
ncbi:MAG: putative HlyD-like secretion protein, partial [Burkholderia sp.]|nr:putative HlyD-like secretion protein [Burkholderia sp.]